MYTAVVRLSMPALLYTWRRNEENKNEVSYYTLFFHPKNTTEAIKIENMFHAKLVYECCLFFFSLYITKHLTSVPSGNS
jgi:hypothetical protein